MTDKLGYSFRGTVVAGLRPEAIDALVGLPDRYAHENVSTPKPERTGSLDHLEW